MRKTRERRRRVHGVVDAVLAFLHLDLGRPADPDYRYAARQLGQPLLEFFAVTQLTLSPSSPSSGRAESKTAYSCDDWLGRGRRRAGYEEP